MTARFYKLAVLELLVFVCAAGQTRLTATAGDGRQNTRDGLYYVYIPPGKFMMGCLESDTTECDGDEMPPYEVEISRGFWIGQTEVTQTAYQKVKGTNPSYFKGANRPVEQVTWADAESYCEAVGMRLPTEAEWEYAARGGNKSPRYGVLDQIAWYGDNSRRQTHEVAGKDPNEWGLYDMLGNVWEWVGGWYDARYYLLQVTKDPAGPASSREGLRTMRGGGYNNGSRLLRVSNRYSNAPWFQYDYMGFRCAGDYVKSSAF